MKEHHVTLIDSTYPMEDAKEMLLSLLRDKIKFLNLHIFSLKERFGSDTSHYERRITELKAEKEKLVSLFESYENGDFDVEIDCQIDIKVKKPEFVFSEN
jgi:hypothetical protein